MVDVNKGGRNMLELKNYTAGDYLDTLTDAEMRAAIDKYESIKNKIDSNI